MFVLQGAQRPALRPEAYGSDEFFAAERRAIFARHWHYVGLARELARDGDQLACTVMDRPVVVRNFGGELRALLNVCAHRHCLIARPGCGHADALRCQYHGWEYDADGHLAKLPDGRSFKGWKAADVALPAFRVERFCGLVFVNLDGAAPPVREYLGPIHAELEAHFASHVPDYVQDTLHEVNWKNAVENAVESYHVPRVHPATFRDYLSEELHRHRLEPNFTSYEAAPSGAAPSWKERAFGIACKLTVPWAPWPYMHTHVFPTYCVTYGGLICELMTIEPLGPRRCRRRAIVFRPRELRPWPIATAFDAYYRRQVRRFSEKLLAEDAGIWPEVQGGVVHSRHAGVLSAREERVVHFQRYVARTVSAGDEPDGPAPLAASGEPTTGTDGGASL